MQYLYLNKIVKLYLRQIKPTAWKLSAVQGWRQWNNLLITNSIQRLSVSHCCEIYRFIDFIWRPRSITQIIKCFYCQFKTRNIPREFCLQNRRLKYLYATGYLPITMMATFARIGTRSRDVQHRFVDGLAFRSWSVTLRTCCWSCRSGSAVFAIILLSCKLITVLSAAVQVVLN